MQDFPDGRLWVVRNSTYAVFREGAYANHIPWL